MKKRYSSLNAYLQHKIEVSNRKYPYVCRDCGHEFKISHYTKYRNSKIIRSLSCFACNSFNVQELKKGVKS